MVTPAVRRNVVAHVVAAHDVSERRACRTLGVDRSSHRYRSRRPTDAELRARIRALAHERRRFGYRRLFILLRRYGEASGRNRIYRLYREEGLSVRRRNGPVCCGLWGLRSPAVAQPLDNGVPIQKPLPKAG